MKGRLFILSNRMPITVEQNDGLTMVRPSSGGLVSAISTYLQSGNQQDYDKVIWAGIPDVSEPIWAEHITPDYQQEYEYMPVFIPEHTYDLYYNGFSNSVIWPLFHYFPSYVECVPAYFDAYMEVNTIFADQLAKALRKDDTVWIHDYHLMPLANMLRERCPDVTIGVFLHIPFPSYEMLRIIPRKWQRELLKGLLGADLVGFHTIDYAKHFTRSVEMILKLDHDGEFLHWSNRKVKVDVFPISINYSLFNDAYEREDVLALRDKYKEIAGGKKLIFSVDRLDYTKGIFNRLKGYEAFLTQHPSFKEQVIFALVVVPSRDAISKYAERKKMIDEYIGNLNSRLGNIGWQPILYQYCHLTFNELIALYTACNLALITPLRDGMNLVAKEFVASRKDKQGVLVLSELAGAARELTDALIINPNDVAEIASMIHEGLLMTGDEQLKRMEHMQQRVRNYDVDVWARDFFAQLEAMKKLQLAFQVKFLDAINKVHLLDAYSSANKKLLLLDYDGTLIPFSSRPEKAVPDEQLLETLHKLSQPANNTVFIISGRDSQTLDQWFGHLPIGLIAEHGVKVKNKAGEWDTMEAVDTAWKPAVANIMERTVTRCPDSFIECKEYAVAWHYRNADTQQAALRTEDIVRDLSLLADMNGLELLHGNKVIEVRPRGINKGVAAHQVSAAGSYDFVLSIGDDRTDEDMFRQLATHDGAFTIKVGGDATFARFNLHNPGMVRSLLQNMSHYNQHPQSIIEDNTGLIADVMM